MVAANPRTSHLRLLDYHPAPGPIELVHGILDPLIEIAR
jgi:hypothetical protein